MGNKGNFRNKQRKLSVGQHVRPAKYSTLFLAVTPWSEGLGNLSRCVGRTAVVVTSCPSCQPRSSTAHPKPPGQAAGTRPVAAGSAFLSLAVVVSRESPVEGRPVGSGKTASGRGCQPATARNSVRLNPSSEPSVPCVPCRLWLINEL